MRIVLFAWMGIAACLSLDVGAQTPPKTGREAAVRPDPRYIRAAELKQWLSGPRKVWLLDVREPQELAKEGAIRGAINIPLGALLDRLGEVPKNVPLVTVCSHGRRAAHAADQLEQHGYQGVRTFGMNEWLSLGYPVEHPGVAPRAGTPAKPARK